MLWYKLKTWYGGEEALLKEIRRTVPPYLYEDVFVIYSERDVRRQERVLVEQKPLFRGCVFLTCKETGTESLFRRLEKIPAISQLIATGYLSMFPLMKKDAKFLEAISGDDHVVRASYVLREQREDETMSGVSKPSESVFYRVYGPLEYLLDGIEKIRFSSRFAKTHKMLWGEDTVIPLGILLDVDVNAETFYNGDDTVTALPAADHYTVLEVRKDETGKNLCQVRESVTVLQGIETALTHSWRSAHMGDGRTCGMERALVSIVMPAFNAAATISEAIDSVLNQTYTDWELIIVNDGSSDSTASIARGYQEKDSRVRILTISENRGVSEARNRGTRAANGDWIAFLDSDDICQTMAPAVRQVRHGK